MSDPVTALAMTGATTLVAAMATSAWQTTRTRVAALFHRRGDSQRDVEAQLDRSLARFEGAEGTEAVHDAEIRRWRDDLVDLLRDHPDAENGLRALIEEIQPRLPTARQRWVQHVVAHDGGSAYGALGPNSSVNVHHHVGSGYQPPASPPEPATDDSR
ncbi:hypothetical protein ACFRQM_41460 [Streptomyces sp. NPDC056831]|uniref:hypothetical protein n=1 Tax=Streptomyces sp. NPDC056831 TaxID=3345954 RepID=UPI00367A5BD9